MARRITFKEFVTALKLLAQGVNVPGMRGLLRALDSAGLA